MKNHTFRSAGRIALLAVFFIIMLSGCAEIAKHEAMQKYQQELLEPHTIPKFAEPLIIPPVMPPVEQADDLTMYHIAVKQFQQQILPSGFPATTVWSYGRAGDP